MHTYLLGCVLLLAFCALMLAIVWLRGDIRNRHEFWWGSLGAPGPAGED
jgi:hypothetical protein